MAKERFEVDNGSCSNRERMQEFWKKLWACRVPQVVKNFLWKACNNILATKDNLFKKHITNDPLCPICNLEVETAVHILWSCSSARDVWSDCSRRLSKSVSEILDFMNLVEVLLDRLNDEEVAFDAIIARQIWMRKIGRAHV